MSGEDVLSRVHARLALADELLAKPKVAAAAKHQAARERYEAWKDLWRAAYLEDGSEELKQTFAELFPPTDRLKRHLTETLPRLREADQRAAEAAAELEGLSRRSLTMPLEMEVGDPRVVLPVCDLLHERAKRSTADASDSVVRELLVQYLGQVTSRMSYGRSKAVVEALEAAWASAPPALRVTIATAMSHLDSPRKWKPITEALEQPEGKQLPGLVMAMNSAGEPPNDVVSRLSAALLHRIRASKRPQDWVVALGKCGGPEAVSYLEQLRTQTKSETSLHDIDRAIADLRRRFDG